VPYSCLIYGAYGNCSGNALDIPPLSPFGTCEPYGLALDNEGLRLGKLSGKSLETVWNIRSPQIKECSSLNSPMGEPCGVFDQC